MEFVLGLPHKITQSRSPSPSNCNVAFNCDAHDNRKSLISLAEGIVPVSGVQSSFQINQPLSASSSKEDVSVSQSSYKSSNGHERCRSFDLNCWEPARPLQRSPRPSGPEMPKKSRKCLPGPPAPRPQKVSTKSRRQSGKSPESLRKVSGECVWSVLGLLGDFLGPRGRRPGRHFRDFFGISDPEGARDLCKGRAGSQLN